VTDYGPLDYPTTMKEWWALVVKHEKQLCDLVQRFVGVGDTVMFLRAVKAKDAKPVLRILDMTWVASPDEPSILELPGWGVLCDLCSEAAPCAEKESDECKTNTPSRPIW